METKSYTLAELQAMPDNGLNALAAELRGWHIAFGSIEVPTRDGGTQTVREYHWEGVDNDGEMGAIVADSDWTPSIDRNQSGELLAWLFSEKEWAGAVYYTSPPSIEIWKSGTGGAVRVGGWDARAETVAFCAAMLAMAGRLK